MLCLSSLFCRGAHFSFGLPSGKMRCAAAAILLLIVGVSSVTVNHRRRFPGNYCLTRRPQQCCPGRDDTCTVPLKDTLCYCDQFCAIHNAEDCCPDYDDVCAEKPVTVRPREPDSELHFFWKMSSFDQLSTDCRSSNIVHFMKTDLYRN